MEAQITQGNRVAGVSSPLGDDVLLLRSMSMSEALGRLFQINLSLISTDPDIEAKKLLGESMTVRMELPRDGQRYFNGLVADFSFLGMDEGYAEYSATLRPWLWFLTRNADCRFFHEMTVPEIIKQVFRSHGFSDFSESLSGTYRKWDYCAQYRETDFNFVCRLMEQEGIYYYFTHDERKHTLVLADSYSAHWDNNDYHTVPYFPPDAMNMRERDHISSWSLTGNVQPGTFVHTDYNYLTPNVDMLHDTSAPHKHSLADFEIFDYPGEYAVTTEGQEYARIRFEEINSEYETVHGGGSVAGLNAGCLFTLSDYPRNDQNREYLVTSMSHSLEGDTYDTGETTGASYSCSFSAIDSKTPFRSPRRTPKPFIQGPQTAVVIDRSDPDGHGRVKVLFHWDRKEDASCWIRVAQPWAGKEWGAFALPQVDDEVVVEFLEGDPDRPLILGSVYNGESKPPYKMPDNETRTTFMSLGKNELSFDDKKGEEEVFIHAEKDMNVDVIENISETVGKDWTTVIKENREVEITGKDKLTVEGDVTIESFGTLTLTTPGGSIELSASGITIQGVKVDVKADSTVAVNGSAMTEVKGGLVKIN